MKRFLLFGYYDYYPCGGWNDFMGDFDTIEEAQAVVDAGRRTYENYNLIDTLTKQDRCGELKL